MLAIPVATWFIYFVAAKIFSSQHKHLYRSHLLENVLYNENPNRLLSGHHQIDVLIGGDQKFPKLLNDLQNAKESINLEYFIINSGIIWKRIQKVLIERANNGVKIKILTDFIGNFQNNDSTYKEMMNHPNIEFEMFNKFLAPFTSGYSNLRSHHKIATIDNNIAYFGGLNIGDDYAHMYSKYGYWYDVHFRTEGLFAQDLQRQFIIDWMRATNIDISDQFTFAPNPLVSDEVSIASFMDGYHFEEPVFLNHLLNQINRAQNNIKLITPYVVLPKVLINAIKAAIARGVNIELITTGRPDKRSAYFVANFYIAELESIGVKVYRVNNFFMHAKGYLFDDKYAIIGTSNLDYRALYLHFEHNFLIKDSLFAEQFNQLLWNDLKQHSSRVQPLKNYRIFYPLIKFIAPIF